MVAVAEVPTRATDMAKKAAKRAGRPSKEGEPYTNPMSVWFTDSQLADVDRAVNAAGISRAEFLRQAALEKVRRVLGE